MSNRLWTLENCSLTFLTLDDTRKKGPKTFVNVKTAGFWIVYFYRHLRSQRNNLIICKLFVKIPLERYKIRNTRMLVTLDDTRKKGQKLFSSWKVFFSEMFVSIDLLGPRERISSFAQKLSKNPLDPYNLLHDLFLFNRTIKKQARNFSSLVSLLFFQNFVCSTSSKVLKENYYRFQSFRQNRLWTLEKCSLTFLTLDDTREKGPKTFVIVKTAVFWIVCFYRLLRSQTNYLIICIINVKIPARPL